jgi:hypothetical protein
MKAPATIGVLFAALAMIFAASLHAAQLPPLPQMMPPIPPSPIQEFRNWLKMTEADRETALQRYSAEKQVILRQKIEAYSAMPVEQRERRLKMLELRWYLRPLMGVSPEQRGNFLEMIPARLHQLVTTRLQQWDQLEAATRREILANDEAREMATRYFVHIQRSARAAQSLQTFDPQKRAELQEKLKRWSETTPAQRERMAEQLAAFFELPRPDQARALESFSDSDRQEMQKALDVFAKLPVQNRRACVESFQKFATMSPAERGEFLRKAERWQQMSAEERATWKALVTKLPPMPPDPAELPPRPQAQFLEGRKMAATTGWVLSTQE